MKKLIAVVLAFAVAASAAGAGERYRVGVSFYNLTNPFWSEITAECVRYGETLDLDVTYVDAGTDSAKQIAQIENFIQSGVDALIVLAIDVAAVEDVMQRAMDAGIKVVDYGRGVENAHTTYNLDAVTNGHVLAKMAADWARTKYGPDDTVEWGHLSIETVEIGVIEGRATEEGILNELPNSKMVARNSTLTVQEGMMHTEGFIQANPNMRLVISLSAGGGVGGNEAIKAIASPEEYDDWGIFSIDATEEEILNILRGDPQKGTLALGGSRQHAHTIVDLAYKLLNNEAVERVTYMPIIPITKENAQAFYDEHYGNK
ncbi:MAG: sugar ABC transporter substrate-binding protein [Planctomycetaceae bacterium]|nr:sugar ABC transporter substrate-binding protein [Planctomycetaceae bacterium]